MNIAIINDNPLIATLVEMSVQGKPHSLIKIDMKSYSDGKFDLVIADDGLYADDIITKFRDTKLVILANPDSVEAFKKVTNIWQVVKKPFLPAQISDIIALLEPKKQEKPEKIEIREEPKITEVIRINRRPNSNIDLKAQNEATESVEPAEPIEAIKEEIEQEQIKNDILSITTEEAKSTKVLDECDIEEIQSLLNDDIPADDDTEALKIKKANEKHKNRLLQEIFDKSSGENKKSDKILDALLNMKHKKLKKLLKNAEVTIKINFPKEKK